MNSTVKDGGALQFLHVHGILSPARFTGPGFWPGSSPLTQKPTLVVLPSQDKG